MDARRIFQVLISPVPAHVRRAWLVLCTIPVLIILGLIGIIVAAILTPPILTWRLAQERRLRQGTRLAAWPRVHPRPYSPTDRDRRDVAALRAALE